MDALTAFFDQYGTALTHGDLDAVASCYATPGLVVSDETSVAYASGGAVQAQLAGALQAYRDRGLVVARAVVRSADRLTAGLVLAAVDWEYLDAEGAAVAGESYRYLLRMLETGPLICVVIPVR